MKTSLLTLAVLACSSISLAMQGAPGSGDGQDPFAGLGEDIARVRVTFESSQAPWTPADGFQLASELSSRSGTDLTLDPDRSSQHRMVFVNGGDRSAILDIDLVARAFLFNAGMDGYRGENDTPNLPDRRRAPLVARQILESPGMLPPERQLELAHIGGLNMAVHREDGTDDEYRKLVTVRFERRAGDTPVLGPGGRIIVRLGEDGRLRGLIRHWEKLEAASVDAEDKRTLLEIQQIAALQLSMIALDAVDKKLESAELVYFSDGFGVMEPAIHLVAQLTFVSPIGDSGREAVIENPYDFYIPLLRAPMAYYPFMEDQGIPEPPRD